MAPRLLLLQGWCQQVANRVRSGNATYATATQPRKKAYAAPLEAVSSGSRLPHGEKGDLVPVVVALGMIATSVTLGLYTAFHQLRNSPDVFVNKKLRETLPEVEYPEKVAESADRFVGKSFFRKVAHVQEFDRQEIMTDPIRKDAYAHRGPLETLQSVGVDPRPQPQA